jgi:hypothetical protein
MVSPECTQGGNEYGGILEKVTLPSGRFEKQETLQIQLRYCFDYELGHLQCNLRVREGCASMGVSDGRRTRSCHFRSCTHKT